MFHLWETDWTSFKSRYFSYHSLWKPLSQGSLGVFMFDNLSIWVAFSFILCNTACQGYLNYVAVFGYPKQSQLKIFAFLKKLMELKVSQCSHLGHLESIRVELTCSHLKLDYNLILSWGLFSLIFLVPALSQKSGSPFHKVSLLHEAGKRSFWLMGSALLMKI